MTSPARHAGIARSITEADDQFARVTFGKVRAERPKLHGARPQERKDNNMIVALTVAWFAVVGLVLIARGDYRQRQPLR